ncbi:MAG TPA: hypothetical protein VFO16_24035 [Pseudonocardiaceae bacterium]|nr:hypothetical protein [Pseudonocardiaceae bacterium]
MPLPYARSVAEQYLYMSLHPCQCGESRTNNGLQALVQTEQGQADKHTGVCVGCGRDRQFVFRIPGLAFSRNGKYGGTEPSQIIDAGEWRLVALSCMGRLEQVGNQPGRRREVLEEALAAYGEMLKFIPPGLQEIPESAFFTERGRQLRARHEPKFFERSYLETMTAGIREHLAIIRD